MEHEARFARLREGHLVRDTDPQDDRPSLAELVIALIAVGFMSTLAVAAVLVWLIGG